MNILTRNVALIACFTVAAAACGGDDDKGYGDPIGGATEQQAASGAIDSIYSLRSFKAKGGSDDLELASVTLGFLDVSSLLSAKLVAEAQQGQGQQSLVRSDELFEKIKSVSPSIALPGDNLPRSSALGDDCVTATADTVTYNNCTWLYGRIDGYVTVQGDHLSFDLEVVYADTSFDFAIKLDGSIDASDTQIVGNFGYEIDANYGGTSVQYNLDGEFDVALADGCAVGGFLEIHGSVTAASGGSGGGWDGWVRAEFGPSCGQVRVY